MDKVPNVRDIMKKSPTSLTPDSSAYEAIDLIVKKKLAGVPVIDDAGVLVGFLTEKDCLRLQSISHQYNLTGCRVQDVMSEIKEALTPEMDLLSAAMQFLSCNFATLPVIDGETLVGSISRQDMLSAIQRMHHTKGMDKEQYRNTLELLDRPSSIAQLQELVGKASPSQMASVLGGRHGVR